MNNLKKEDDPLLDSLAFLRELNFISILFRLILAMLFGGMIGMERGRKRRPAGFRTYMLVCLGATLTMLLGQYHATMLDTSWAELAHQLGVHVDTSRYSAQVINGIGFLGAGTILVTRRQEVKGLTTAAGLWASACMGLAVGAGFYECVVLAFVLIALSMRILPHVETLIVEKARNINIYVEFAALDDVGDIITRIKALDVQIYEVDIDRGESEPNAHPKAIFSIHLNQKMAHTQVLAAISELESVYIIEEI